MANICEIDKKYVAGTYARFPVTLEKGEGSLLWDETGKKYIDMGTGIAVNTFGIGDRAWIEATTAQLSKLAHTSNLYYTEPCARLAELLCERTGFKKVFFGNSGAEANECAIKAARKYAAEKKGEEYYTVVTLLQSFHGRTITTLAATGQETFHTKFQPLTPGFVHTPANDIAAMRQTIEENKVAAVMLECVQGEGGVCVLTPAFVQETARLCAENDILLIIDEVQTGNGRTGTLYAYMQYGIMPDIITTAKGLGGGLPIGAVLFGEKTENVYGFGDHGSTFGGNPVCCAGAISILKRLDEALLLDVREKSEYIRKTLTGAPGVEEITGLGLMLGIKTTRPAAEVLADCREKGVLFLTAKDKVRLLPALNIPMETLREAIEVLKESCGKVGE